MEYEHDLAQTKSMTSEEIKARIEKYEKKLEREEWGEQEKKRIRESIQQVKTERGQLAEQIDSMLKSSTYRDFDMSRLSGASQKLYMSKIGRMQKAEQYPSDYCSERNLSKSTYHTYKSAMKYWITDSLRDAQNLLLFSEYEKVGWKEIKNQVEIAKQALSAAEAFAKIGDVKYQQEKNQTRERRLRESGAISKRRTLRGLPSNWRAQIQGQLQNSKYRDAATVLHLAGCRPGELQKGVRLYEDNGAYCLQIKGGKQSEISESGQFRRVIKYERGTPAAQEVEAVMARNGGDCTIKIQSTESFQKTYKAAAVKALGRKGGRISPYSARHQFCADLKAGGYSKTEIAAAMGHQSTRSQGQYGTVNQGTGSGGMSATASQEIRNPDRTPSHQKSTGLRM